MPDSAQTSRAEQNPAPDRGSLAVSVVELGRLGYDAAYEVQQAHHAQVLAAREGGTPELARLLLVEHDPVVTVTRRKTARGNLLASLEVFAASGIDVRPTDRGGDVTYHGPGQLVCYPIVDLRAAGLRLHEHMRVMEQGVIDTLAHFGVAGERDGDATGVWIPGAGVGGEAAKIAAMGVRVRRWITLHGLSLNVRPNMAHFALIVPCGLAGRSVTRLAQQLGERCPAVEEVAPVLTGALEGLLRSDAFRVRAQPPSGGAAGVDPPSP